MSQCPGWVFREVAAQTQDRVLGVDAVRKTVGDRMEVARTKGAGEVRELLLHAAVGEIVGVQKMLSMWQWLELWVSRKCPENVVQKMLLYLLPDLALYIPFKL